MKNKNARLLRKVLGVTLALAMTVTSVTYVAPEKQVKAASSDAEMGTDHILDESDVKDPVVLKYYTILANAEKNKENKPEDFAQISTMTAGEVLAQYGSDSAFNTPVFGSFLVEYSGEVDLAGISITDISGIGWARSATKIDMSSATIATAIPDDEFANCKGATTIILPSGVTSIGARAFQFCTKLKTLKIGEGSDNLVDLQNITNIGDSAFFGCSALENVQFGTYSSANELKVGKAAFASCSSLQAIELPIKTATNIGENAFENCSSLAKVGLHDDLKYISNAAFKGVGSETTGAVFYVIEDGEKLYSALPSKITYIGEYAFAGTKSVFMDLSTCTALTTIKKYGFSGARFNFDDDVENQLILPDSLTTLEEMAFSTSGLVFLSLPDKCTNIGTSAFSESAIISISLPQDLEVIPKNCFWGCEILSGEDIEFRGDSQLTSIGESAFQKCKMLKTTEFLEDLTNLVEIKENAFADCYAIEKYNNSDTTDLYGEKRVICGLEKVVLPNSVEVLGERAFANDYYLQEADLGSGITDIPAGAFKNDVASKNGAHLAKVIVSDELKSIGNEAFMNQFRLATVGYTDGSQTEVEEGTVQFASGLNSIGDYAFANCGVDSSFSAPSLLVYVDPANVSETAKAGADEYLVYQIGDETYRSVYINKNDFQDAKTISAKEREENALYLVAQKKYTATDGVAVPDTTHTVGARAYSTYINGELYKNYLYNLGDGNQNAVKTTYFEEGSLNTAGTGKPVYIIPSKESIGRSGEEDKDKEIASSKNLNVHLYFGMKKVIIPDTLKNDNLGKNAFENCINLEKVTLSENLTKIQASTFSGAGVMVANWESNAPEKAIYDYHGLQTINMPDGLEEIENSAFYGCKNLNLKTSGGTSFGRKVKTIGDRAFSGCVSLTSISFPSSLISLGEESFANCAELRKLDSDKHEYSEDGNSKKYTYYLNLIDYGTKTKKTGLSEVNFTAASNLETIKKGAFKQTNITSVNLTKSKCLNIPDSMFEQCSYLKTISFQDATESIGANVLKDNVKLESVSLPALAVLKDDFISGAFGDYSMDITTPTDSQTLIVPYKSSLRLPVNAVNEGNINGSVTITATKGDEEIVLYEKGQAVENTGLGLTADVEPSKEGIYSFSLNGDTKFEEPIIIKVATSVRYAFCGMTHFRISPATFTYKVNVADVPTTSVSLSAAEDANVKSNPYMYEESTKGKVLYIPVNTTFKTKGINLSAQINPAETTEDVQWATENESIVLGNETYVKGTGVATATVYANEIGNSKVTVTSGNKSDVINVYCVIPATQITCAGSGVILGEKLTSNSSAPYALSVGDTEKISATLGYDTQYSEEQIGLYGEKVVYISSDPEILRVDEDGSIKALKEGNATITVEGQASGTSKRLVYYFEVSDEANYVPTSVIVSDDGNGVVAVGKTIQLSAEVKPSKAAQTVTWSMDSLSARYATIDEKTGKLTALAAGTVTVYATSTVKTSVKSAAYKISVVAPSTKFDIFEQSVELETGKTYTLSKTTDTNATKGYMISPADTTDSITWTSEDASIVNVERSNTQSVTFKAVAPGTAKITGTTTSGLTKSITVKVIQKVQSIKVDSSLSLEIGGKYQLIVTKVPETATEEVTYTYTSGNTSIATVSETGLITALKEGSTTIRVTTNTGKSTSCTLKVTDSSIKVTGVQVDENVSININGTYQLNPKRLPENATQAVKYTYTTDNDKIATVSETGLIKAISVGTARITVKTDTGKSATCTVNVKQPATKLTVNTNRPNVKKMYMAKGQVAYLNVTMAPKTTTDQVTYSSSKKKVADVSPSGAITAKAKGKAKITVKTTSGKKVVITVIVSKKQVKAKKVKIKCKSTLKRKKTMKIKVTLKKASSTDTISFSSSKPGIASVDSYGNVKGLKKGKVKITVTAASGKKASKKIKIK